MSISREGISTNDPKPNGTNKTKTLNPNAAEFIPLAFRSSGSTGIVDVTERLDVSGTSGKAVLDRSESTVSNNSDEEAHQYWCSQLPDDITPDFNLMGEEDAQQGHGSLSFAGLSIHDGSEGSRFSASTGSSQILSKRLDLSSHGIGSNSVIEKMRFSVSSNGEDHPTAGLGNLPVNHYNKRFVSDQDFKNGSEGLTYNGNSSSGFLTDMQCEQAVLDNSEIIPLEFLSTQYPGFAVESLAEVYYANGCDLNLTIEMLTQLELQVNGDFNKNQNLNIMSGTPNLSALDPTLPVPDGQNGFPKYDGVDLQKISNPYRSADKDSILFQKSRSPSRGAIDFSSAARNLASQDTGQWKYEGNGSGVASVGSSGSHILASSYISGHERSTFADRLQNHRSAWAAPVWLETGETVANMHSELREEARDHARFRNAYFEQARQAYIIGSKALAKELSVTGQLHSMHMKVAHGKAQEAIYRQRNPVALELQGYRRGQEQMIDLLGLHVSEAIHVLRHEMSVLRSVARSTDQRLQVYICVGTGHHTKGSHTPARLPLAVEHYLLEEQGLEYTEPQPGLLRVVIH